MNKTVSTQKDFRKNCKDSEKGCCIGTFLIGTLGLLGVVTAFHCLFTNSGNWCDNLLGGLELLTIAVTFFFASKIFNSMKKADTPFAQDVSGKIKNLSLCIEISAAVCVAVSIVLKMMGNNMNLDELSCIDPVTFLIIAIGVSEFIKALSRTYAYGAKLQQESDETL